MAEIVEKVMRPPPLIRPSVSMGAAPPEAVSVMRQCWSESPDLRPDFHTLHDVFRHMHRGRQVFTSTGRIPLEITHMSNFNFFFQKNQYS